MQPTSMSKSAPPRHQPAPIKRPSGVLAPLQNQAPLKRLDSARAAPPPVQKSAQPNTKQRSDETVYQLIRLILSALARDGQWISQEQTEQLYVQLSKTIITQKSLSLTVFEPLRSMATEFLTVDSGSITLDLTHFARLRAQGLMGSGESQVVLDLPEEIQLGQSGESMASVHEVYVDSAVVSIDGRRFLPLLAPRLVPYGQRSVPLEARLELLGPTFGWAVLLEILATSASVCRAPVQIHLAGPLAGEDLWEGKLLGRLCSLPPRGGEEKTEKEIKLGIRGPAFDSQLSELPENPLKLFRGLLQNKAIFANEKENNFPEVYQDFFHRLQRHISNDIGGIIKFAVLRKARGDDSLEEFLQSICCDFESLDDAVELEFDVDWFLESYVELLSAELRKFPPGVPVRVGGELFRGTVERAFIAELAASGEHRLMRAE